MSIKGYSSNKIDEIPSQYFNRRFSLSGIFNNCTKSTTLGYKDFRGKLFLKMKRILKEKQPDVFIAEM
jgi:site-specific DNA-cytosine methylase